MDWLDPRRTFQLLFIFVCLSTTAFSQCPQVQAPCHCAPSVYEPVAIVCENAGSLTNALQAISNARQMPVSLELCSSFFKLKKKHVVKTL